MKSVESSLLAIALLCVSACQSRSVVHEVDAVELAHIIALPDSSFFSDLRHLNVSGERIYALDVDRRQVLSLDKKFEDLWLFGSGGRGPAELLAPFSFTLHGGDVFIYDSPVQAVKIYSKEGFQDRRELDFVPYDYRWYERDGEFWMPLRNSDSLIVKSSPEGDVFFGKPRRIGSDKKTSIMNGCCVLDNDGEPLAVYMMLPYARQYSSAGVQEREIDLSGAEFYGQNMAYIASRPTKENSAYILHQDAVISGARLFLLCPRYGKQYRVDRILEVDIPSGRPVRVIRLPEGVYGSIALDKDIVYAFNSGRGSLDMLKVSDQ